ncbi:hypothetical protein KY285_015796 [Solanum tuberosum]|nr:hypothetical protein KY285_015796 [Solanum tuberosum]
MKGACLSPLVTRRGEGSSPSSSKARQLQRTTAKAMWQCNRRFFWGYFCKLHLRKTAPPLLLRFRKLRDPWRPLSSRIVTAAQYCDYALIFSGCGSD